MAQDDPYDKQAFVGRSEIVEKIVAWLVSPDADRDRRRSVIVEGPAGRGKSWLLKHIYEIFEPPVPAELARPDVVACLFRAGEDFSAQPDGDRRWHRIIARVCLAMRRRLPNGTPGWLTDLIGSSSDELTLAHDLAPYEATAIFPELVSQAEGAGLVVVLIVDSLEEIDEQTCADFETHVLVPLMRSRQMRLLTARRVDSRSHDWRKYTVRNQTKQEPLPPLDQEPPASDPPVIQQLERLIMSRQQHTRPDIQPDAAIIRGQREALIEQARPHYLWGNPGVNSCLTSKATDGFSPPRLQPADVEGCLRERLRGPRPAEGKEIWSDDLVFATLATLVRTYEAALETGVLRTNIAALLGMQVGETIELLAYLQELGIGLLNRDGSFQVHPEFVQLFAWLSQPRTP